MKNVDDIYKDEELLYKPTRKKKKPKKANHKHVYENCVFDIVFEHGVLDPSHGFRDKICPSIGTYCPICGKIGSLCDSDNERWYEKPGHMLGVVNPIFHADLTEEGKRELDPATRTLPYFFVADWWQKGVELD